MWYRDLFGEGNYYIELQDHGLEEDNIVLPQLIKLARETGIPMAATNDSHYLRKEDAKMQAILLCIQTGKTMQDAVKRGLEQEGVLPGPLNLRRKASTYYIRASGYKQSLQSRGLVFAYALAVSEENASGGVIVTAPTCGSCGIVPAVLYHLQKKPGVQRHTHTSCPCHSWTDRKHREDQRFHFGSGSRMQAEVGVACSMASAAANQLFGGSPAQIEYAAEMGLEHHLGMTCDPVCGLVQIPCIERNAYAAARALDANLYSSFTDGMHRVSFDKVVEVMKETGNDLPSLYKETSEGGLAKDYKPM